MTDPTYHRWFILPVHEFTEQGGETYSAPAHVKGESRLGGHTSGGPFTRQQVEDAGYDHLLAHDSADEWRVVLAWGEGNDAWNALNEIHANHHNTETLADHGQDVAPVMDQRFGDANWSVDSSAIEIDDGDDGGGDDRDGEDGGAV